jgi:hypothetical protein
MSVLHPVASPEPQPREAGYAPAGDCRDHVHVFLVNGLDPLHFGNLVGVRDYVRQLGFENTYYGELYDWWWFKKEIRRIHGEDPEARLVLVGFSLGGSMVHSLARSLKAEGVWVDLLVYVDAKTFFNNFHRRPENVGRVLNVTSLSCLWNGKPLEGAENVREGDVWHFGSPTHPDTLKALAANLALVAAAPRTQPPAGQPGPTPAADGG